MRLLIVVSIFIYAMSNDYPCLYVLVLLRLSYFSNYSCVVSIHRTAFF